MTDKPRDFDDLAPDEKLFALAARRGDERAPLLTGDHIQVAARMLKKEPDRYAKLLGRMAGWASLSVFKQKVQKFRADAEANFKKKKAEAEAEDRLDDARRRGLPFIAEGKPTVIARDFIAQCMPHLIRASDEFLEYHENAYRSLTKATVRSAVQGWMASGVNAETGETCYPNKTDLDNVMDMLAGEVHRNEYEAKPPTWFDYWEGIDPEPTMCIAARNGILDVATDSLMPLTPRFFTRNGLTFDYDPNAPEPEHWLNFLESIWPLPEGQPNHDALQEIMGHLLTGDSKYQKVFMLVGPPRAGKGTITRVITAMCGEGNVAEQSAHDLGENFGMANLVGKQVLIVPDLRLDRSSKTGKIMELLLNISGGDRVGVNRKFKDMETMRLNTRVVIATNKELMLPDQSGAFNARLVPLVFHKSFVGREDRELDDKLAPELPSIMNWALAGLKRLEGRRDEFGRHTGFTPTPDGKESLQEIARHSAPIKAFLEEWCELSGELVASKTHLFDVFEAWCEEHDIRTRYFSETFAKDLRVASGYVVDSARMTLDGHSTRVFTGIGLKDGAEDLLHLSTEGSAADDF